jgi:hypothetical protein
MKYILIAFLFLFVTQANAQRFTKAELKILHKKQDSLSILSWRISNEFTNIDRLRSDSLFTRILVRTLALKNSFYFGFDSVQIAKVYAPDSSFKIFTWQIEKGKDKYRQRGVIQYKTTDGKMKITPLIDNSEFMEEYNVVTDAKNWVGALYYNILLNEYQGKKIYTLLGFDENNKESNKKWIEVLTFNEKNEPVFGGPYFKHTTQGMRNRFDVEYKKESHVKINWDPEQQMIIYDHLSSENGFVNQRKTYVPDGDYEGFKWDNGMWVHNEKVMCNCPLSNKENKEKVNDGLFDANGNKIENKLDEKSIKNMDKKGIPTKPKGIGKGS